MTRIFIILCVLCTVSSCRERAFLDVGGDEEQMLSFVSTISPEAMVMADILPAISLTAKDRGLDPYELEVLFDGSDVPGELAMQYDAELSQYLLSEPDYRPSPGGFYEVTAFLPDSDMDTIHARTHIPIPMTITDVEVLEMTSSMLSDGVEYEMTVAIRIGEPHMRPAYLQLIPRRKISTYRIDDRGEISITYTNEAAPLAIDQIASSRAGTSLLVHEPGVYIDYSRMSDEPIILVVRTPRPIDSATEIFRLLEVEIKTLSEELYLYHQSLHKQIINSNGAYPSPVTHYTNVENGLGVLGSYSTRLSTIEIIR